MEIYKRLNRGTWERPSDTMAVYTEIEKGQRWGVRVTLIKNFARVEAIDGPRCSWYKTTDQFSTEVRPPSLIERLRGVTFVDKLMAEVERKREVARQKNG